MKFDKLPKVSKDQIKKSANWEIWIHNSFNWARLKGTNILYCYTYSNANRFYWLDNNDSSADKTLTDTPQMYFRDTELKRIYRAGHYFGLYFEYEDMLVKLPPYLSDKITAGIDELAKLQNQEQNLW